MNRDSGVYRACGWASEEELSDWMLEAAMLLLLLKAKHQTPLRPSLCHTQLVALGGSPLWWLPLFEASTVEGFGLEREENARVSKKSIIDEFILLILFNKPGVLMHFSVRVALDPSAVVLPLIWNQEGQAAVSRWKPEKEDSLRCAEMVQN